MLKIHEVFFYNVYKMKMFTIEIEDVGEVP